MPLSASEQSNDTATSVLFQPAAFGAGSWAPVIVGGMPALWLVVRLALALVVVKICGEIWWISLNRRIAKPR